MVKKNAMLENIFPLGEWTNARFEKASPSSSTNDTKKHAVNEVFKEGREVVILDCIFLVYRK